MHFKAALLKKSALLQNPQSLALFEPVEGELGYSTIVMPRMKATVVSVSNKGNGTKRVVAVYKPPTNQESRLRLFPRLGQT